MEFFCKYETNDDKLFSQGEKIEQRDAALKQSSGPAKQSLQSELWNEIILRRNYQTKTRTLKWNYFGKKLSNEHKWGADDG